MKKQSLEQLQTFCEKADIITNSTYLKKIYEEGGLETTLSVEEGALVLIGNNYPNPETIAAIVLTARMFFQTNDRVSFERMADLIRDPGVSQEWKDEFHHARDEFNKCLASPSQTVYDGNRLSNKKLLHAFVYGNLAHTDPKHVKVYKAITSDSWKKEVSEMDFHHLLVRLTQSIEILAQHTALELGKPEKS